MTGAPLFVERMRDHAVARPNNVALIAADGRLTRGAPIAVG
jgi:hypothetical protein